MTMSEAATALPRDAPSEQLRRREWVTSAIDQDVAVAAIESWHYAQGAPNTSVVRTGLYRSTDPYTLLGVAMWLPPTKNAAKTVAGREWRNVLCLTRFVLAPSVPTNGASFLLGASMRQVDRARWPWLLTYADSAHGHTGAIYKATNWTYLGPWDAGDTWTNEAGEQRGRKRGRRNLSADEMRALGFERSAAAVKHKFVHHLGRLSNRVDDLDAMAVDERPVVADVTDTHPRLCRLPFGERAEEGVAVVIPDTNHEELHEESVA